MNKGAHEDTVPLKEAPIGRHVYGVSRNKDLLLQKFVRRTDY